MYIIFVDSYKTGCYNKDERLLEILDFMNRKTMSELENLAKGGNWFMKQALKFIDAYLANDANKGYGSQYDLDVEIAREEGEKAGKKAGMKAGIKSNQMSTARKMLADGMTLEKTAEYTGLSIKVLERLKN